MPLPLTETHSHNRISSLSPLAQTTRTLNYPPPSDWTKKCVSETIHYYSCVNYATFFSLTFLVVLNESAPNILFFLATAASSSELEEKSLLLSPSHWWPPTLNHIIGSRFCSTWLWLGLFLSCSHLCSSKDAWNLNDSLEVSFTLPRGGKLDNFFPSVGLSDHCLK